MEAKRTNIFLALLIYLPTIAFIPLSVYLVLILIVLFLNKDYILSFFKNLLKFNIQDINFALLLGFALIAFVLRLSDYNNWESLKDFYSFAFLFPFTYIVARTIRGREKLFDYILFFIFIEVGFAILEYILGVSTVFTGLKNFRHFPNYDLLYYTRVFGLSSNSSGLAIKLIIGLLLIEARDFAVKKTIIYYSILIIGSILTFGRIALIVVFFYFILKFLDRIIFRRDYSFKVFIPFAFLILFFSVNPNWSIKQFTRNNISVVEGRLDDEEGFDEVQDKEELVNITKKLGLGKLDMSGRNEIWNTFFKYSLKNIHFGNKGKKFMIGKYHAHNSYLELLSSVGIYLFLIMGFILIRNLTLNNYLVVGSMVLLAFGQYLIFWGLSFADIIFYYFIFFYKKNES